MCCYCCLLLVCCILLIACLCFDWFVCFGLMLLLYLVLAGLVLSFTFDTVGLCWVGLVVIVLHIYFVLFV